MLKLCSFLLSSVALTVWATDTSPSLDPSKIEEITPSIPKKSEKPNQKNEHKALEKNTEKIDTDPPSNPEIDKILAEANTNSQTTTQATIIPTSEVNTPNHTGAEGFVNQGADNMETLIQKIFKETPNLQPDSLTKSMADAYQTSPQIKQQVSKVRATVEKTVQAKAGWRPTINGVLSSGLTRTNNSGDSTREPVGTAVKKQKDASASAKVELRQNLFAGGQTINQMKETESAYKSEKAALVEAEQKVLLDVSSAYMSLMSKYAQIELLKRNETNLKETLKATQDKYDVGEETRTSVAQADAQLADGIAQRIAAEGELEQLKGTFEKLTFRKPGKLAQPKLPRNMPKTLEEAIERARTNSPSILKAMQDEKTARYTVDRVTGALLPSIDLVGSSGASRDHQDNRYARGPVPGLKNPQNNRQVNHSVQVQMSIPLYEAGNTRSQRREASENAEQQRIVIEQTRRAVSEQAVASWNKFKAAEGKIVEYKKQVQANLVSLDGTQQELLVGSKILLDVLNAIRLLVQSQVNLVAAEQDYLAAAYELMYVTGDLTAKAMGLKVDIYDPDIHYRETTNSF